MHRYKYVRSIVRKSDSQLFGCVNVNLVNRSLRQDEWFCNIHIIIIYFYEDRAALAKAVFNNKNTMSQTHHAFCNKLPGQTFRPLHCRNVTLFGDSKCPIYLTFQRNDSFLKFLQHNENVPLCKLDCYLLRYLYVAITLQIKRSPRKRSRDETLLLPRC